MYTHTDGTLVQEYLCNQVIVACHSHLTGAFLVFYALWPCP